jgi:hypothetical protein
MRSPVKVKKIYLLPLPLVLVAALSGCYQGQGAATGLQDETGNGIEMRAGDLQVESVTVVAGELGQAGSVTAVIVNSGTTPDTLRSITVDGKPAVVAPADTRIEPQSSVTVRTGGDVAALVPLGQRVAGEFVDVTFLFTSSGEASDQVLIVPPIGYYSSVAPALPGAAAKTPAPSPTASPAAEAEE